MRELGRRGGLVKPSTRLRRNVDDELREQARQTLSDALAGKDVPKSALDAARSLFSYRADAPPFERQADGEHDGLRLSNGRRVLNLADVIRLTTEIGMVPNLPDLVAACRELVAAAEAGGARVS